MKVSIDGGATWLDAPEGVRVDYPLDEPDKDGRSILFNFGAEGVIFDLYPNPQQPEADETACVPIDNLTAFLALEGDMT